MAEIPEPVEAEDEDEDEEQEVEVAAVNEDEDDDGEEPDTLSDWNVPSWNELIASLYRPDR